MTLGVQEQRRCAGEWERVTRDELREGDKGCILQDTIDQGKNISTFAVKMHTKILIPNLIYAL